MDYRDYYAALGVEKKATKDEIQKAYRKLARKYHPDVNKDPEADSHFKEINEAYEVLKDSEKRARYDQFGSAWKQGQSGGAPPPGFEDIFSAFRGAGGGRRTQRGFGGGGSGFSSFFDVLFGGAGGGIEWESAPSGGSSGGADHQARLSLTLDEAAGGGEREITLQDPSGGASRFKVRIPAGVRDGQKIRVAGKGGRGLQGAGDLYLLVDLLPHPTMRFDGDRLVTTLPITPWEAALGAEADVPTLNGTVRIKVPAGSSSGRRIRIKSKGFPDRTGGPGDLLVELRIVVPTELSADEKRLFSDLAESSAFDPRD